MEQMLLIIVGVVLGAIVGGAVSIVATNMNNKQINKRIRRREVMEELMREIDILLLLNKKIQEILQKRTLIIQLQEYVTFDRFDDCYITVDDYIYLQSFCAQNHYYLPRYLMEEFFNDITHRQVVLAPEQIEILGANAYKGGRRVLEDFSDELIRCADDCKIELKQLKEDL